jgi:putative CocE/NonD family hydrolase
MTLPRTAARLTLALLVGALLTTLRPPLTAQTQTPTPLPLPAVAHDVKATYEKQEVQIPMRDGVKLFTIIYTPRDRSVRYPILLTRTGYGIPPYGPDEYRPFVGPSPEASDEGFIVVYQDVRGRFKSEGTFIHHVPLGQGPQGTDESTDAWDTIDWLVKHVENHNGRVGQWGISWPGWEVAMGMINAHPALKASSPQAPPEDQFFGDDYHSGGAYQLAYGFNWMANSGRARNAPTDRPGERFRFPDPDGYKFFLQMGAAANATKFFTDVVPTWADHMTHGTYDAYWQARNVPKDLKNITHAVLIVGGWFDAEDFYGTLGMYRGIEEKNPKNDTRLVIGPWTHGAWSRGEFRNLGAIDFGTNTAEYFRREVELPFFNFYLKDKGTLTLPKALMFETGRNTWRSFEAWPPRETTEAKLYLQADRRLTWTAPVAAATTAAGRAAAFDEYVSDPAAPVPFTAEIATTEIQRFAVEDQRFASKRPDVLTYESEPLADDVTIAGPVSATLHVSTTGTDSDFVAKLIDVLPSDTPDPSPNPLRATLGGYQMLVVGDVMRAKFRASWEKPTPMTPGKPAMLTFELGDRYHTFRKGHRIMVQVQSSWFPMIDRNPQTFVDIYHASPSDYRKATQRVYHSRELASHLTVRRLPPQ